MNAFKIVLKTKGKHVAKIKRDCRNGGGIIRIDEEACGVLESILNQVSGETNIKDVASALIKAVAEQSIIIEEEE